jgi:hypothetical protein
MICALAVPEKNTKSAMESKIPPKKLLQSAYRKEMWKNVEEIVKRIEKVLPVSSMHLMGSFVSKKTRPADVDFIVMLKTPQKSKNARWSLDLVIAPDNKHGKQVEKDAKEWVKEKYGEKNCDIIKYR